MRLCRHCRKVFARAGWQDSDIDRDSERERALFGVCEGSNTPGLGLLPARHALSFRLLPAGFAVQ